jgi:DNA-binding transcriptional MerR regulator
MMRENLLDPGTCSQVEYRGVTTKHTMARPLRSGQLARLAGVSPDTLRHYERHGLISPALRSSNGYRHYPPEALGRLRQIRAALGMGFTVKELSGILRARNSGDPPCKEVRDLAIVKAHDLKRWIAELTGLHDALTQAIRSWNRRLKVTPAGHCAHLLESFVAAHPESTRLLSPQVSPALRKRIKKGRNNDE